MKRHACILHRCVYKPIQFLYDCLRALKLLYDIHNKILKDLSDDFRKRKVEVLVFVLQSWSLFAHIILSCCFYKTLDSFTKIVQEDFSILSRMLSRNHKKFQGKERDQIEKTTVQLSTLQLRFSDFFTRQCRGWLFISLLQRGWLPFHKCKATL